MNDQPKSNNRWPGSLLPNVASIFAVATAMIYCNGGIGVGASNHVGLLPVVRRILDPNYLPGDFNIALRFYHHRAFAYLGIGVGGIGNVFPRRHQDPEVIVRQLANHQVGAEQVIDQELI